MTDDATPRTDGETLTKDDREVLARAFDVAGNPVGHVFAAAARIKADAYAAGLADRAASTVQAEPTVRPEEESWHEEPEWPSTAQADDGHWHWDEDRVSASPCGYVERGEVCPVAERLQLSTVQADDTLRAPRRWTINDRPVDEIDGRLVEPQHTVCVHGVPLIDPWSCDGCADVLAPTGNDRG